MYTTVSDRQRRNGTTVSDEPRFRNSVKKSAGMFEETAEQRSVQRLCL